MPLRKWKLKPQLGITKNIKKANQKKKNHNTRGCRETRSLIYCW